MKRAPVLSTEFHVVLAVVAICFQITLIGVEVYLYVMGHPWTLMHTLVVALCVLGIVRMAINLGPRRR